MPRVDDAEDGPVDVDALRDLLAELLARRRHRGAGRARPRHRRRAGRARVGGRAPGIRGARPGSRTVVGLPGAAHARRPETLLARILADLRGAATSRTGSFADEVLRREIRDRIAAFRQDGHRRGAAARPRRCAGATRWRARPCRSRSSRWSSSPRTPSSSPTCAARVAAARAATSRRGSPSRRRAPTAGRSTCAARCAARCPPAACRCTPRYRTPRPGRPELVLLCDVSGSVAGFSHFTMLLVQALREQFSRCGCSRSSSAPTRSPHLFAPGRRPRRACMQRVLREADLVAFDGHSDYGGSLGAVRRALGRRDHVQDVAADPRRRPHQLPGPQPRGAAAARRDGPARALAQPRAASASGAAGIPRPCATPTSCRCTSAARRRSSRASSEALLPV